MALLTQAEYLRHLRAETRRFRDTLADLDLSTVVPSCPDWDAADLLWHLAEVQWFWASMVRGRPKPPPQNRVYPPRPPSRAQMIAALDEYSDALHRELAFARPEEPAWSWVDDQTVGFTLRRQTHEALIHRVDAEQARGVSPRIEPRLAADGVHECLGVLYARLPQNGVLQLLDRYARVECTDTGNTFWLRMGLVVDSQSTETAGEGVRVLMLVDETPTGPDVTISGDAADLDLWLWHRADGSTLAVEGDPGVYAHIVAAMSRTV